MPTVSVNIPGTDYDVRIEPGALNNAGAIVQAITRSKKAAIITDSIVGPLYAEALVQSLKQAGIEPVISTLPAGEEHKNLSTLLPIFDELLSHRMERSTPVLALGGGVVGDMAGFVAATILRGVPFVQIPTTLLAMVDASVGGKVGVDTRAGKNLIGAFHQPILVLADPLVLATLPPAEMRGGLAECIKHDIIRDAAGFDDLEKNILRALAGDVPYLTQLIAHNVAIKAKVVAADPHEKGERAHLNLGHTFGHAIEIVSNFQISHGQGVSLGTTAAAFVGERLGLLTSNERHRIKSILEKVGLPTTGLSLDPNAILDAMRLDKKVKDGRIRFILPMGIGQAVTRDDVPDDLVRQALQSLH
ncbi:MAG TPA: 3-dehydroquinate synthase [Tepidisphaeraceae bacterium]|nr:3-dehydroquinate synthase [Tepidisphaeraceae bacterium]